MALLNYYFSNVQARFFILLLKFSQLNQKELGGVLLPGKIIFSLMNPRRKFQRVTRSDISTSLERIVKKL